MLATSLVHYAYPMDWTYVIGAVALAYAWSLRRAGKRTGASPGPYRIASFSASLAILLLVFATPIDAYAGVSLFDHTVEHLLLVFVVAPLFALGAPVGVLLDAAPPRLRDRVLVPLLRSRAASVPTHPAVAVGALLLVMGSTLFTPLSNAAMTNGNLHLLQHALLLVIGFLLWHSLAGVDLPRHRVRLGVRLALMVLLVGFFASVGVALLLTRVPLYHAYATLPPPWGGRAALVSQHDTGGLLILGGGLLVLAATAAVSPGTRVGPLEHELGG